MYSHLAASCLHKQPSSLGDSRQGKWVEQRVYVDTVSIVSLTIV